MQKDLNVWFLSLQARLRCNTLSSKNQIGTTRFQVKIYDSLSYECIFLSFERLRYDLASHKSQEKPILTFLCILS